MARKRYPASPSRSSWEMTTRSAWRSMTSVRSPPLPRLPVSTARSAVVGASAKISSRPATARRQTSSQSASNAERVEVMAGPMLSDVASMTPELSPAQREAVTHSTGSLLIKGAAGTGKTTVLQERFLWLVGQGIRPERVAVLTPSSGRADALRSRLEGRLLDGYEQLFVMTPVELAALLVAPHGPEL